MIARFCYGAAFSHGLHPEPTIGAGIRRRLKPGSEGQRAGPDRRPARDRGARRRRARSSAAIRDGRPNVSNRRLDRQPADDFEKLIEQLQAAERAATDFARQHSIPSRLKRQLTLLRQSLHMTVAMLQKEHQ
jgi:hypothetical protein